VTLLADLYHVATRSQQWVHRHPRRVATAVLAVLAGFGATAFGLAPLAPDAARLPQQLVTESVTPEGLSGQLEALADHELELSRNDLTRASDTADTLLQRLGVDDPEASAFLRNDPTARHLLQGRAGKMVQVRTDGDGRLLALVARYAADNADDAATRFTRLTVQRDDGTWQARLESAPLQYQVQMGSGTIRSSLFAATDEANLPDGIANQLVEMFSTDVDFRRELRRGDSFSVVYQALTADGEPITWNQGAGHILAAQFVNAGHTYQAVWYADASGKGTYFDFAGKSKRHAFLASPLAFSRITSGFSMRMHPILGIWKKHLGVDYGAPIGTPVRVVGDGTVAFAGVQNGYGNVIMVQHSGDRMTVYAHLSRIDVRRGQHVDQGQHIGDVGMTGWATGPHLHFEFRLHGTQQDPLVIARSAEAQAVAPASASDFAAHVGAMKAELAAAASLASAHASAQ
jgi:murein DD-endopeptidase MepM/ murein hydrolase activator NlpD